MDLASRTETMVYDNLEQDMQETWGVYGMYPGMDWTPGSEGLVFWSGGRIHHLTLDTGAVKEIPFHVRDTREIYPAPLFDTAVAPDTFRTRMVRFPRLSPDGDAVVFESLGRLYIRRGNAAPRPLTRDNSEGFDYAPVWSPDGDTVYFLRWSDDALSTIRRVAASGGRPKALEHEKGQFVELAIDNEGEHLAWRKLGGNSLLNPDWDAQPLHLQGRANTASGRAQRRQAPGAGRRPAGIHPGEAQRYRRHLFGLVRPGQVRRRRYGHLELRAAVQAGGGGGCPAGRLYAAFRRDRPFDGGADRDT